MSANHNKMGSVNRPLGRLKLRASLVIPVTIAIIILAILTSIITISTLRDAARKSHINDGTEITHRLSRDATLAVLFDNPDSIKSVADSMVDNSKASYAAVYNKHGELVYQIGEVPKWKPERGRGGQDILTYENEYYWHFTSNIVIEDAPESFFGNVEEYTPRNEIVGYVHTTISKEIDKETLNSVIYANLTVTAIFIILIAILIFWVAHTVTQPIKRLSLIMSRYKAGSHDERRVEASGPEEIIEMTEAFNMMVNLIEEQNSSLKSHADDLEITVEKRTKDLIEAKDLATKLNSENRDLIRGMNDTLENERKFVARELHDHLNALLVAIKLRLNVMKNKDLSALESSDKAHIVKDCRDNLDDVISMVADVYDSSRNIVRMLRPEVIDSLGLVGAIEDTLSTLIKSTPDCTYRMNPNGTFTDLPYTFSIAIYRIAQESLTNAVKHASASKIVVNLSRESEDGNEVIELEVIDNGAGFDVGKNKTMGIGLLSMRERAYALGGQVIVKSKINDGTTVSAIIPIPKVENHNHDCPALDYEI